LVSIIDFFLPLHMTKSVNRITPRISARLFHHKYLRVHRRSELQVRTKILFNGVRVCAQIKVTEVVLAWPSMVCKSRVSMGGNLMEVENGGGLDFFSGASRRDCNAPPYSDDNVGASSGGKYELMPCSTIMC
jgi:hypothetical protein